MTHRLWTPPTPRPRHWLVCAAALALFALSHLLDEPAYQALYNPRAELHDWYQALRALGYMPTWIAFGVVVLAADLGSLPARLDITGWWRRGAALILTPLAAGGIAELLKLLVGRERPAPLVEGLRVYQGHIFKPWDPSAGLWGGLTDSSNLGLPSSHAAVAIAGAFAIARVWPGALAPALFAALGCALTRLLHGAHFFSDVFAGALLGYALAWLIVRPEDLRPGNRS